VISYKSTIQELKEKKMENQTLKFSSLNITLIIFLLFMFLSFSQITFAQCTANFDANQTSGCAPLTVQFSDKSTQDATEWYWYFEGGAPSEAKGQGPHNVIYNNPGNYDVTLKIVCQQGSNTKTTKNYIVVTDCSCEADFIAQPSEGCATLSVVFTDQSINATNWNWTFPGGNPSSAKGAGPHNVKYTTPGEYDATLQINCQQGSDTETKTEHINVYDCTCEADFSTDQTSGCAPLTVKFTDNSENATSWLWTFNGGSPASAAGAGPHYVSYNNSGSYDVKLEIDCPYGSDKKVQEDYIQVNDCTCEAEFVGKPTSGCFPLKVTYTDMSENATSWNWSFPGGSPATATGEGPHEITYKNPGLFNVMLDIGCPYGSDSEKKSNYIQTIDCTCEADFKGEPTYGTAPLTVEFFDLSQNATNWAWSFPGGDPPSATGPGPHTVTFNDSGSYNISLEILCANNYDAITKDNYIVVDSPVILYEYGDAPEGVTAYPSTGTIGNFPTCEGTGPTEYIRHSGYSSSSDIKCWLGLKVDYETEGNEGECPDFFPNKYDLDESCDEDDGGLLKPDAYTITGNPGSETVVPLCELSADSVLGRVCQLAKWGENIDIVVNTTIPNGAYVNVLFDWNQDGEWGDTSECCISPDTWAPEHVLENFHFISPPSSNLSAFNPPNFRIGPNPGNVWARFTITEKPIELPWDGSGEFYEGETEDYLLKVQGVSDLVTFNFKIDTTIKGMPAVIPGEKQQFITVGVILNPKGIPEQFSEGEVVLEAENSQVAEDFAKKHLGYVISDGSLPEPDAKMKKQARDIPNTAGFYLVKVDPGNVDINKIPCNAQKLGLKGTYTFSSLDILQLFGLFLEEIANGNETITLNMVMQNSQCVTTSTQEWRYDASAPNPALANEGYNDAYQMGCFTDPDISLIEAWQLIDLLGSNVGEVDLCVIDQGFIINDDFPSYSEYDFVNDDRNVDAHEADYHAMACMSMACAARDNRFGSVGTGAQVAYPMAFRHSLSMWRSARAIRTATSWGADIVSMSFHYQCDWYCSLIFGLAGDAALNHAIDEAYDNGVVLLAAAGNQEMDLDILYYLPIEGGRPGKTPIGVGAISLDTKRAVRDDTFSWGSCYGSDVDIWAPGAGGTTGLDLWVTPLPGQQECRSPEGTSLSTPYVAGIVAMMKAVNPSLSKDELETILQETANTSPDSRVTTGYVNAFESVQEALFLPGSISPAPDECEPNDFSNYFRIDSSGEYCANLSSDDIEDGYHFYVDDIRSVNVREMQLLMGSYISSLRGFGLPERWLPFHDVLLPGLHFIHFEPSLDINTCFYELEVTFEDSITIEPDRFEVNNTLATCAELIFPSWFIDDTWEVDDINFHIRGDVDYFEIEIPTIRNDPTGSLTDRLTIWIEPNERGYSSDIYLTIYDASGAAESFGRTATINHVSDEYADRRIRFSVQEGLNRRNFYRMIFGYDRFVRGVAPPPETLSFFEIPEWMDAEPYRHFIDPWPSFADGLPFDIPYPSDPEIVESFMENKPVNPIPTETMIVKLPTEQNFGVEFSYYGLSPEMNFSLIDHQGKQIASANDIPFTTLSSSNEKSQMVKKRMGVQNLKRGIYGIQIDGTRFPTLYSVKFDSIKTPPDVGQFFVKIDTTLKGDPETIPGKDQLEVVVGVIQYQDGRTDQFVENEVVFKPENDIELNTFLEKWDGKVLSDGSTPAAPHEIQQYERKIPIASGFYRIQVNTDKADTGKMADNAAILKIEGNFSCSSEKMKSLFALILEEYAHGNKNVNLNMVFQLTDYPRTSTQEYAVDASAPNPALPNEGFMDAFLEQYFNEPDIAVTQAWQLVELFGADSRNVALCVIDVGFNINDDFPIVFPYDFIENDVNVNAAEHGYHGTRTLSIACANYDDRFGAAGTGAPVALPMPFRFDLTYAQGAEAIRTAIRWGAQVVSNSWSGDCNWCETFEGVTVADPLNEAIDEAFDNGLIVLASAGNDEVDIGPGIYRLPAEGGSAGKTPIVVGANDMATKRACRGSTHGWGSAYGTPLDIWVPVEPRHISTPTPTATPISTIGRTSGACAYTAGVVAMMRALNPDISVSEVKHIIRSTANSSPDVRVSPGYINAIGAVLEAAQHENTIIPIFDDYEPNDFRNFYLINNLERYCANLSADDVEDGYYFYNDDIRYVRVRLNRLFMGDYLATISGGDLTDAPLPFEGRIFPGGYYVRLAPSPEVNTCFYELRTLLDDPSYIPPDRFEENNTLTTSAELVFPPAQIDNTWEVDGINFHVNGDPDYFEIVLPELSDMFRTDRLTIWIEPDESGYSSSFNLILYDDSGSPSSVLGRGTTIENVSETYSDGRVRFLVRDAMDRRNFYRIAFGYDQYVPPPPVTLAFFEIPWWIEAETDWPFLDLPPAFAEGLPLDLPFPFNPTVVESFMAGKPMDPIPTETIILKLPLEQNIGVEFSFEGESQEMSFSLIDSEGKVIATAMDIPSVSTELTQQDQGAIKRMDVPNLKRGIYGIRVDGSRFPMFYTVKFDHIKTSAIAQKTKSQVPSEFVLSQNYPNPFNPTTEIHFALPKSEHVTLSIYNLVGQKLRSLVCEYKDAGHYVVLWNAKDDNGNLLPSGVYIYRFEAENFIQSKKLILVK